MNIVCLELTHHIRLRYSSVDITHYNLLILIPQKYLELSFFQLSSTYLQYKSASILTHL